MCDYFTIRQQRMFPSYTIDVEEHAKDLFIACTQTCVFQCLVRTDLLVDLEHGRFIPGVVCFHYGALPAERR